VILPGPSAVPAATGNFALLPLTKLVIPPCCSMLGNRLPSRRQR
jgi:hypothetical protein